MKPFFYSTLVFLAFSCVTDPADQRAEIGNYPEYRFYKYDSITVDYLAGNLTIVGKSNDDIFLGIDYNDKTIILFTDAGQIVSTFNRSGGDYRSFGNIVYAIDYYNDSTISILSEKGVFFYDKMGELIKKLLNPDGFFAFQMNSQLQILPVFIHGEEYVLTLTDFETHLPWNSAKFYEEAKFLTLLNVNTNDRKFIIMHEPGDLYRNGKFYYPDKLCPFFGIKDDEIYVKYPLGEKIYVYSIDKDFSLSNTINLFPEYLEEAEGVPFDNLDSYRGYSPNGSYQGMYMRGDTTFMLYNSGFDIDRFTNDTGFDFYENPGRFSNEYRHLYRSKYFQLLAGGKKIARDILLPSEISSISFIESTNSIIGSVETNWSEDETYNVKFYKYRVEIVP